MTVIFSVIWNYFYYLFMFSSTICSHSQFFTQGIYAIYVYFFS